jgi:hypothetical protein
MKKLVASAVAALGLAVVSYQASAITVSAALPPNTNLLSDNSAEILLDNAVGGTPGVLDVGDSLRGIVGFNTYEAGGQAHGIGAGTNVDELTGLFQVIVTGKTPNADGTFDFTFAPDPAFEAIYGTGAVAVLYDDPADNFARQSCGAGGTVGTPADCEATATGGTQWAIVGDNGSGTFFWTANNAQADTTLGANVPLTTPLGSFSNGVNVLVNNTGLTFGPVPCADLTTNTITFVQL